MRSIVENILHRILGHKPHCNPNSARHIRIRRLSHSHTLMRHLHLRLYALRTHPHCPRSWISPMLLSSVHCSHWHVSCDKAKNAGPPNRDAFHGCDDVAASSLKRAPNRFAFSLSSEQQTKKTFFLSFDMPLQLQGHPRQTLGEHLEKTRFNTTPPKCLKTVPW